VHSQLASCETQREKVAQSLGEAEKGARGLDREKEEASEFGSNYSDAKACG
jgi:hypothetical protein